MNPGEAFEIRCFEYLKNTYATKETRFDRKGGMDSTTSDIAVIKNNKVDYYIEAKDSSAQSGQFVLLPDETSRTFIFSPRNHSEPNDMTDIIIEYMNQDFDRFNNAGTSGESLDIDTEVFAKWIVEHYKNRNVKYFMSYAREYIIFPIRKFTSYFDIVANYRIKKSGSGDPAKKDYYIVNSAITEIYPTAKFYEDGKKLFVELQSPLQNDRFQLGKYTYYFSKQEENIYRIKRLSNTYNMNVIFSIELKKGQASDDLEEFESDL